MPELVYLDAGRLAYRPALGLQHRLLRRVQSAAAAGEQPPAPVASTAQVYTAPPPRAPGAPIPAVNRRAAPSPAPQQPYAQPAAPAPASRGGLPLALDEKQLKVTLMLDVVKLISPK